MADFSAYRAATDGSGAGDLRRAMFISNWNAYLWPLIVLRDVDVRTLPIILTWYNDAHTNNVGLQMAASVLVVMPICWFTWL